MTGESFAILEINHNLKSTLFRIVIFLLILFWCFGFTFPSLSHNSEYAIVFKPLLEQIYSGVCHQNGEKTFAIFGSQLLVCARCTGIYFGALISVFITVFFTLKAGLNKKLFFISFLPIIADVLLYSIGIYNYSKELAFAAGLICGSIVIIFIFEILEKMFNEYFL